MHRLSYNYLFFYTEDIIMNIGTLEAGAEFSYGFKLTGEKLGKFNLIVGLNSNKTEMVTGEKEVSCFCIDVVSLHGQRLGVPGL